MGQTKEDVARKAYIEAVSPNHTCFKVTQTGLHLHPSYPYLGASPDGIIKCSCCGLGLLEIKCPYSKRDVDVSRISDPKFYLKDTASGLELDRNHDYYMQVQGQLFICNYNYCDFVCWSPKGMHIERIQQDPSIFLSIVPKLCKFFFKFIVREILHIDSASTAGDHEIANESEDEAEDENAIYCFCRQHPFGVMIACDNKECPYEWFHVDCVGIVEPPDEDEEWYCDHCRS